MSIDKDNYWGKLAKIPLKNEQFLRKEELKSDLNIFFSREKRRTRRVIFFARYAAAILVLSFLTGIVYLSSEVTFKTDLYAETLELPGGSDVVLGSSSELKYNRIQWLFRREVELNGSGRFSVSKGSKFIVSAKLAEIEVLGTVFEVAESSNGEKLSVACFEGSVKVSTPEAGEILNPGDSVEVTDHSFLFIPKIEDFYTFNAVPVSEVAKEMERYFKCSFVTDDKAGGILFSGMIPTDDLENALTLLTMSCDVNYKIEKNTVYLYK